MGGWSRSQTCRPKPIFDIETCPASGGAVRSIACIEDPDVVEKIMTHLDVSVAESRPRM